MPRKPRELYPHQYFHLICQSNNHFNLYKHENDFQKYLGLVHYYFRNGGIKCFHYVLMNTHAHLIVQMPDKIDHIPEIMKGLHLTYNHYYRFRYHFEGNLWRSRYKSELIDTDRYMLGCGLYIEHNPVKAGMVKSPEDYPWSSYKHWAGLRKDPLLSEHPLEVSQYRNIAQDYLDAYLEYVKFTSVSLGRPRLP